MSELYYEVAVRHPGNRGIIVPASSIADFIRQNHMYLMSHSYFLFDEEGKAFIEEHGAMNSTFGGKLYLKVIWLDIDDEDLATAYQHAQATMKLFPEGSARMWFSGKKGFHLQVANVFGLEPSPNLADELRGRLTALVNGVVDYSPIRTAGMIRAPWTRHQDTGRFKVPVYEGDTLEEILGRAENPREALQEAKERLKPLVGEGLLAHVQPVVMPKKYTKKNKAPRPAPKGDASGLPLFLCTRAMWHAGPKQGTRHQVLLRMVSVWRRQGLSKQQAYQLAETWLGSEWKENPTEWARVVDNVYERGYQYSCSDEVMKGHCSKACWFFQREAESFDMESMGERMREYARRVREGFNLAPLIGVDMPVPQGTVMILSADTGMGKSALVQNWLILMKRPVLYINTEVSHEMMVRRFVQIAHGVDADIALHMLVEETEEALEPLSHIRIVSGSVHIRDLDRLVREGDERIVVVDVLDDIETGSRRHFDSQIAVIRYLRQLALKGITVIAVHHISKSASRSGTFDTNALTGAKEIANKADIVLMLTGSREATYRMLKTAKMRDGRPFEIALRFDPKTFVMSHEGTPF